MFVKSREKPPDLLVWRSLLARMNVNADDRQYFMNLTKGFEGEQRFDEWLRCLPSSFLILNDLTLEFNQTVFQLDSLVLTGDKALLFEVKNYEGDYFIEGDYWYSASGNELRNPLYQLKRSESLLKKLLQRERLSFPIESYLVFIHPEFVLLEVPRHLTTIIHPGQLSRFFSRIQKEPAPLHPKNRQLAERLLTLHLETSPYRTFPTYDDDQLKKGILCSTCLAFLQLQAYSLYCPTCQNRRHTETGVLQSVQEYQLLFPQRKITTSAIYDWTGELVSVKVIRRVLKKHFTSIGSGRGTYFVDSEK